MSQIVTGDAVLLDLRPARVPTRVMADLLDIVIMATLSWVWAYLTTEFVASDAATTAVGLIGYIVISFGYLIAFETLTKGRTPGAYIVGLQTVRDDGGSIRLRHAVLRGLSFWLVDYSVYTGFLLGTIISATHPEGKRIGDILAGTLVIRVRAPKAAGPLPELPPELSVWASHLEMSRVTNEEFAATRALLQRGPRLRADHRAQLFRAQADLIARRVAPPPPPGTPPELFLAAVAGENRRRAESIVRADQHVPSASEIPYGWR